MSRMAFGVAALLLVDLVVAAGNAAHKPLLLRVELSAEHAENAKALHHSGGRRLKDVVASADTQELPSMSELADHLLNAVFGFKAAKRLANQGMAWEGPAAVAPADRVWDLLKQTAQEATTLADQMQAAGQVDVQGPGRYWWHRDGAPPVGSDLLAARSGHTGSDEEAVQQLGPGDLVPVHQLQNAARSGASSNKQDQVLGHATALEQATNNAMQTHVLQHPNIWASEALRRWYDDRVATSHVAALESVQQMPRADDEAHKRADGRPDDAAPSVPHHAAAGYEAGDNPYAIAAVHEHDSAADDAALDRKMLYPRAVVTGAGAAAEDPFSLHPYIHGNPANPAAALQARQAVQQLRQTHDTGLAVDLEHEKLFGGFAHPQQHPQRPQVGLDSTWKRVGGEDVERRRQELVMFDGDSQGGVAAAAKSSMAQRSQGGPEGASGDGQSSSVSEMNEVMFLKQGPKADEDGAYEPDYYFETKEQQKDHYDAHRDDAHRDDILLAYDHFPDSIALQNARSQRASLHHDNAPATFGGARDISNALAAELIDISHEGYGFLSNLLATPHPDALAAPLRPAALLDLINKEPEMDPARVAKDHVLEEWFTLLDITVEWSGNNVVVNLLVDADAMQAAHAVIDLEHQLGSDAQGNPLVSLSLSVLDSDSGTPQALLALVGGSGPGPLKLNINDIDINALDAAARADARLERQEAPASGAASGLEQLAAWMPGMMTESTTSSNGIRELANLEADAIDLAYDDDDDVVLTLTSTMVEDRMWLSNESTMLMMAGAAVLAVASLTMAFLGIRELYSAPSPAAEEVSNTASATPDNETKEKRWISVLPSVAILPRCEQRIALEEPLLSQEGGKC